jgi:DNA-binding transcriptional ArsR family regulator
MAHKITRREDVLELKTRSEIYNFISKYPGCHLRELSKKLKIHRNTVDYHVKFLKKRELLEAKNESGYCRYYAIKKGSSKERVFFNIFRQTVPRNIILFLFVNLDMIFSPKEMKKAPDTWVDKDTDKILPYLQKHTTTLIYHLDKLEELDIVERIPVGKEIKYRLKNPEEVLDFLIEYQHSLFDDTVPFLIKLFDTGTKTGRKAVNKMVENIFDIFPHPYHV